MPKGRSRAAARAGSSTVSAGVTYADRPWLASYPAGVPTEPDFPQVPVTQLLDDSAAAYPEQVALAFLGTKISYRQLKSEVDRFASALAGLGVRKGDRVALVLPNCPQNVIAFFATLRLGAVVVEHNPLYTEAELRHQLADCGARVVICLDRVYATVAAGVAATAVEHVVTTSLADWLPRAAQLSMRLPLARARKARAATIAVLPKGAPVKDFRALLRAAPPGSRQAKVDPATDLATLQYTGGTTGVSRGAMLSHANLVSNAWMNRMWDTGATPGKEVTLAVLPLFHAYGLTVAMLNTVLLGGTLVLLPRFDLDQVFEAVDRWRPTLLPGVPPIYKAIADSPKVKAHDLRSIRLCVSGAMRLPVEIAEHFTRVSGATLIEGYGMTETSPCTHANPTTGPTRPGTIGLPLPGTFVKLVEQDDPTTEVPVGSPGEMAIAGPQVFAGYWGRQDQDGVFAENGYLLTGDVAVMDADGWFTIVDRKKELIIAGGFNIYPSEVEEVLLTLDGVEEAVVVGVPDRYRGETVKAFVVAAPGVTLREADVMAHCSAFLTAYKVPRLVEVRESLPRSAVGKILRRALVEQERAKAAAGQEKPASVPGGVRRSATQVPAVASPEVAAKAAAELPAVTTSTPRTPVRTTSARKPSTAQAAPKAARPDRVVPPVAPPPPATRTAPAAEPAAPRAPAREPAVRRKEADRKASGAKPPESKAPGGKAPGGKAPGRKAPPLAPPAADGD